MKLTDYINGRRGREIVANWGSLFVVLVMLGLTVAMYVRSSPRWQDFPSGVITMVTLLVSVLGASNVAQAAVNKSTATSVPEQVDPAPKV